MNAVTAFAATTLGRIHYAEEGTGDAILLLHQTPRSWREYEQVLPLLAAGGFRAIAMDTLGFGDSDPAAEPSIEAFAAGASALLDALELERTALVGHHTGGVVAVELAAAEPERVTALVLSSTPYCDEDFRRERAETPPPVDRAPFYPSDRPELLEAYAADAERAREKEGHRAVERYRMEGRTSLIKAPTLLVAAPEDPFAYPHLPALARALPDARVVEIAGGMIPLPDQLPAEFARAVLDFLEEKGENRD